MPAIETSDACTMYSAEECHADLWGPEPETVLLVHGMAESARSWTAWVPHLSRRYRPIADGASQDVWNAEVRDSYGFLVLPVDGYHIAAALPDLCAEIVAAFLGGCSPVEPARLADVAA